MAYPASSPVPPDQDEPPLDPAAIERAYRLHRAKRQARHDRRRDRRRARVRFWFALACVLAGTVFVTLTILNEIQQLFGL
jgi:hypothetical protein